MSVKKVVHTSYIGQDEHAGFEFNFEPVEGSITIEKNTDPKSTVAYVARYLVRDDDARSPDEDDDGGLFLVGYNREFTVDRGSNKDGRHTPGISQELAQEIANNGKNADGEIVEEAREYVKKYHIFPLEAYIHSGVRLYLSGGCGVDRAWDVSQLGMVFASKKEWKTRAKAEKAARGLIETWNDYLDGNVYGIVREDYDSQKQRIGGDECWGFYGYDYALKALKTDI